MVAQSATAVSRVIFAAPTGLPGQAGERTAGQDQGVVAGQETRARVTTNRLGLGMWQAKIAPVGSRLPKCRFRQQALTADFEGGSPYRARRIGCLSLTRPARSLSMSGSASAARSGRGSSGNASESAPPKRPEHKIDIEIMVPSSSCM